MDVRDVALSCRLGLEAELSDAEVFVVAAADTVMNRPSAGLVEEVFPATRHTPTTGTFGSLLSIEKAHRLLGYEPRHSWRDHVSAP